MTLLAAEKISKKFNDQIILENVSFTIKKQDMIGLVGKNGIGKTTLLEILADKQSVDEGAITRARDCVVDYVEQEKTEYLDQTLFEFVAEARRDLIQMRRKIREIEHYLEENPHDEKKLELLGELQHIYETDGGFDLENEVKIILVGLGFEEHRFNDYLRHFSGGEKNRAGLARLLAGKGNLLLLDEPTNHLDIESTRWLEEYLQKLEKACVIVSHDRTFLSKTVQKVWELAFAELEFYSGNFEYYLTERENRRQLEKHYYKHQQEEIKRIEDFIQRNMAGQKTKQAQSKLKYLNRIKRLPPPKSDERGPSIKMESSRRSFAHILALEEVAFGYDDAVVVDDVNLDIYRGDKIGLIGRNGSGKTTVIKTVIGELSPVEGSVRLGNKVDVSYFDQDLVDLNENATVLDNLWEVDQQAEIGKIRSFLARFGFTGEDPFKMVKTLSGGEKTKLSLARLLYHPSNFIILDEPTNHLDIYAREALEKALIEYEGSCLIVSHDRFFLDRVANRIVYISDGRVNVFDGNYSFFAEKTASAPPPVKVKDDTSKKAYLDFKEQSRRRSRHQKNIQSVQSKIADHERELNKLETDIQGNIPKNDWEKLQEATDRKKTVENKLLKFYEELEELEGMDID